MQRCSTRFLPSYYQPPGNKRSRHRASAGVLGAFILTLFVAAVSILLARPEQVEAMVETIRYVATDDNPDYQVAFAHFADRAGELVTYE